MCLLSHPISAILNRKASVCQQIRCCIFFRAYLYRPNQTSSNNNDTKFFQRPPLFSLTFAQMSQISVCLHSYFSDFFSLVLWDRSLHLVFIPLVFSFASLSSKNWSFSCSPFFPSITPACHFSPSDLYLVQAHLTTPSTPRYCRKSQARAPLFHPGISLRRILRISSV